jgi:hypothetical protein
LAQLYRADALFLTNALRGVRAVHSWQSALGTRIFQPSSSAAHDRATSKTLSSEARDRATSKPSSSAARDRATNEPQPPASALAVYVQRMLSDLGFKA